MATCSHESGCTKQVHSKGLCKTHYYQQWRAARAADPASPRCHCGRVVLADGLCTNHYQQRYRAEHKYPECKVAGCKKPADGARGWCEGHHYRFKRYGDPLGQAALVKDNMCSMNDGAQAQSRWIVDGELKGYLCGPHERRWRAYGDPAEPPRRAPDGSGWTTSDGYRMVMVDGKRRREHVVFMEQLLGRPLGPQENVHHRNGVKTDNTVDGPLKNYISGNLELWSTKQPKGQRVADKIAFAIEILREYAPEVLA